MNDISFKTKNLPDISQDGQNGHVLHTDWWQNQSQQPIEHELPHSPISSAGPLAKKRKLWNPTRHHTLDHRNCPACEAVNERIMNIDRAISSMTVPVAAERWVEWKRPYVLPRTTEAHVTYLHALNRFFGSLPLNEITAGHLREYQRAREANADGRWKRKAGASAINHELNVLAQILEYAGLWKKRLKPYYHPVRMPRWTPRRVMTPEEEARLFEVASSNPAYELAYLVTSLTNNTTASGCELRLLQIKHVSLHSSPPEVLIPSDRVKNNDRGRRIPLNATAHRQAECCLTRAARLGSVNHEHYLFPFRSVRNTYDPTRPASRSWLRKQFEAMRIAAGLPWLRPHDLRHQAITRLLEAGMPDQTVMAVAGHVSRRMMNHYSHIRMDAKMAAVNAIEPSCFQVAAMRQRV